jgi:hypothetical protein
MLRVHSVCCVAEPATLRSDSRTARQSGILLATSHLHHRRRPRRPRVSCRRVSRLLPHTATVCFGNHSCLWGEGVRWQPLPPRRRPPDQVRWSEMSLWRRWWRRRWRRRCRHW